VRAAWQAWLQRADHEGRLAFSMGDEDPGFAMTVAALRDSGLVDPVALRVTSTDLSATIDVSGIVRHRAHEEARLREMAEYAETTGCRRGLILRYFGEQPVERCEACDNCLGRHEDDEVPAYPPDLYDDIVVLRDRLARSSDRDPYLVFENRTARELATYRPASMDALRAVWGIGERRAAWFGQELLRLIAAWEMAHPASAPAASNPSVQPSMGLRPGRATGIISATSEEDVRPDDPLYVALRAWRTERAKSEGAPAYTIFADRTLRDLVRLRPRNMHALMRVWGLGESRVDRFGRELLEVVAAHEG
jgi:ATP-dependent DNA helicase RecQ